MNAPRPCGAFSHRPQSMLTANQLQQHRSWRVYVLYLVFAAAQDTAKIN